MAESGESVDAENEPAVEAGSDAGSPSAPSSDAPPASTAAVPTAGAPSADASSRGRGARKIREGTVVSDKMQSTVVVAVTERVRHARYGKTVQRTKKLYADDTFGARVGDRVRLAETRPVSKLKRWRVTEVMERAR
jgi:small subunit ribosomal protein S17